VNGSGVCIQADLVERLTTAVHAAQTMAEEEKVVGMEDALENVAETAAKTEGMPELAPGTQHIGKMTSAEVCATLCACMMNM